jgi:hypothetical protein
MPTLTVVLGSQSESSLELIHTLASSAVVSELLFINHEARHTKLSAAQTRKARFVDGDFFSGAGIGRLLDAVKTDYMMLVLPGHDINLDINLGALALERIIRVADESTAGLLYSDFKDVIGGELSDHPLIDYQLGSVRDNFDFGAAFLISRDTARAAINNHGRVDEKLRWAGLYDLRLKLSIDSMVLRISEPLYTRIPFDPRASGERQFDYVDPQQREYQLEMEQVATEHLKRIGAYLTSQFKTPARSEQEFPVRASVVIPVRNRERTIADAVGSALSQQASFDFNVIVIDNHSTDRTSAILEEIASRDRRLIHLRPTRNDLGIGGCWNEAVFSSQCGEYAVQLDSDDLYSSEHALAAIVAKLEERNYAMMIGAYKIVNFDLEEIPPGLIDHREWTRENGRNNALRINGLGAPRAFYVPVLRQIGFPNVSYGEDYSVALRISREYEIARSFEPLYLARRWEGNSDAALPIATANRYDAYKDHLRTVEILARKRMNQR